MCTILCVQRNSTGQHTHSIYYTYYTMLCIAYKSLRQLIIQLYTNIKIINVSRGEQGQPWLLFNIPTRGFLWETFIIFFCLSLRQPLYNFLLLWKINFWEEIIINCSKYARLGYFFYKFFIN